MMFRSFMLAGFECATGYNARGHWIDQVAATHHDMHADADYALLRTVGIRAAREAIRWPLVDLGGGRYDFETVLPFLDAAQKHGIDVIWDLFHFGFPPGLDLFSFDFPRRFEAYCHAAAAFICPRQNGPCYFTPINEPSFFAWAAGEVGRFAPYWTGRGPELKRALARAAIRGIDAIRAAVPTARIVNVDPLCHVAQPPDRPDLEDAVRHFNERSVWEAWDMICGRLHPELGGTRTHLDIVGMNYYWTNQWEHGRNEMPLSEDDPRRVGLGTLLRSAGERYGGDLILTETAHVDDMRPRWLDHVATEAEALLAEGFPLRGICLYPILGMPEWHAPEDWVRMGLWDLRDRGGATLTREIHPAMLEALRAAQRLEALCRRESISG
jgi:beta-glucosidase/6-phospho-beta-glucosidase/beta-galactosidase